MAPRSIHQGDAMSLHQVISPLFPRLPRVLPTSTLGEDIADDIGRRRLFQAPDPGLEQAAREDRVSTEGWRGSLSSVSSNYSRPTCAASVRPPKKRFGRLFSLFKNKEVRRADSASLNSRHSMKKVSTAMHRAIGKFVGNVRRRRRDGSMAEHHNPSVPEDVGGLLGDLRLPDLVQNRINNGNVTPIAEQSPDKQQVKDKHASIIATVETTLAKDVVAKDKDATIMPVAPKPWNKKAKDNSEEIIPVTPEPTEKNAKFEELSQVRSSKSGNEGYAALRGEKYNSKGPLYDDLAFADAKPKEDSEDVRRSGYNSPELDHNEREFSNTYDHVPASPNLTAADRKPRTKSDMADQTGYLLIGKQLVDPDSLHDTNRAERGLPAGQWEGSKVIAQMPDSPSDNNKNLITDDRDIDDKGDVGGQAQEDGPSSENKGGLAAGNLEDSTADASLSQDERVKARVAAWENLTGKKAEPAAKKSLGDSMTTGSSNNSPDRPLVSDKMIIEMAKGVKRVETRSTANVESQTHKAIFEHTRKGPKPPSNREDIQDAKHRRQLNKSPGGGSKLSEYSVETHPSPKDTNEGKFSSIPTMAPLLITSLGHDLTRIPQLINKNTGAPLMAPGQSSGIVYDRGRRNSVRRMKRSESLRPESAVSDRTVMPKSESKSTVVHTGGTLQTPGLNDPQALATPRIEEAAQVVPAELPAVAVSAVPVTDPAVPEVDLSQEPILQLIEKVPTVQLMHIFHERLLKESDEREVAMEAQASAALNEATGPIHGLAYDYEQACLNRVAVAELKEFRKTLHYTLNGWRTEQVMMAAHWDANHASHEVDRKYAQNRLKEAKDKLIEVTRRINASDAQYTTMVQNMNKVRCQRMENARRRMGREDFETFERSLGSSALSVNSSNGCFSPAPQPNTPHEHITQYNRHAFNYNANPSQSRPPPGVSPYGHQHGPVLHPLQQMHSSPYVQPPHGRQPPIFSSPSYNNINYGSEPSRRHDPSPEPKQETPRHRPSYAQPDHVPVLSTVPELTPEAANVAAGFAAIPPSPTPTRARNSSAPAGPQLEPQQHYRRVVSGVVAGATRAYRQPPPPLPIMTPERVRELVQPRSAPQNYRGVEFGSSPSPAMLPPPPKVAADAAGARESLATAGVRDSFVTALGEADAPLPPTPVSGAEHVGDTEDLVLPPLPSPVRTDEEMEQEWQREQREKNQQRSQHRTPMMAREDSKQAVWYTGRQYPTLEQQWRAEQERERLAAELGGIVVGERSLDYLRMDFVATRGGGGGGGVETAEERELREVEEEIRRMEEEEAAKEKSVLGEEEE